MKYARVKAGGEDWEIAREFSDPRLEVIRLLHDACEVEHALMLQYLYGAYSLRERCAAVARQLVDVALEEMFHLRDVNRILVELGATPNLARRDFPYVNEIYPFAMELERLSRESVAKYVFAEAPRGALQADPALGAEIERALESYPRTGTVPLNGSLYRTVIRRVVELGEAGHPAAGRWIEILGRIRDNGEHKHFEFFVALFRGQLEGLLASDWDADKESERYPSLPARRNPTTLPDEPGSLAGEELELARIADRAYWASLLLLESTYRIDAAGGSRESDLRTKARDLMEGVLQQLGRLLGARGAGLPFDALALGCPPCPGPSDNLALAADLLGEALGVAQALPPDLAKDLGAVLRTLRDVRSDLAEEARRDAAAVVIGAGPAGLAAAFALAARGVPVRVIEKSSALGGKVYSEEIGDGPPRSVEHGVHGWWPSYLNFFELLRASGVDTAQAFVRADGTNLFWASAKVASLKPLPFAVPSPAFLPIQLLVADYLGDSLAVRSLAVLRMMLFSIHVLAFRHETDYASYDEISLHDLFRRASVPKQVQERLFRPFSLNLGYILPQEASAAAILSAFQFYTLPANDAMLPSWTREPPARSLFRPIADAVERRAGRVDTSVAVRSLVIEDGALRAVDVEQVRSDGSGDDEVVKKIAPADVPAAGYKRFDIEGGFVYVGRDGAGNLRTLVPVCSHQGGELVWEQPPDRFRCLKHSGTFDANGARSGGPPLTALAPQPAPALENGELVIRVKRKRARLRCADAILATDLSSAKAILAASAGAPQRLASELAALETTPVLVVRMWFPRGTRITKGDLPTAVTKACRLVDNYFHLNRISRGYDPEGEVVEVQGARNPELWEPMSDEEVVHYVIEDLKSVSVMLKDVPPPLHYAVMKHTDVFTKYNPRSDQYRPGARSGVDGLYLAGDWTRADWSVWFMERAVVSGLRAANALLRARGLAPYPILRLPREGLLLRASRFAARSVKTLLRL